MTTATTTASLLETSLLRCGLSSSVKFKGKFESSGKHVLRTLKDWRIRCVSDDPGSRPDLVSSRRKMVVMLSTVQLLSHLVTPYGSKAADIYPVMQNEIRKVVTKGKAAGVLRLVFHDAGTFELDDNSGGINGSIAYELERPENTGLKKSLKVLAKAKVKVDEIQPVSWADMISVAGSEAVSICGGPTIPVLLGRLDSTQPDPEGKLPPETLSASGLKECFKRKGFSTQELVALSGAHTIGSKGFGDPTGFDNAYYKILLEKPWTSTSKMTSMVGLPSDHALVDDDECLRWVKRYAEDQDKFFEDFTNAYIKLVNSGAKWKKL
ncbi:PREDICTED: putative L-ascorbate peroxidase 6 isoform X2 [Camelina sativa]|uniref:L-ascorbate peroxidase n=1 Tax=Camelina sativa TaxID=90675 RepID=A0ABM0UWL3_CAMSA|nr:PREDICTED: putative L-ascorbate peroxidase 6 isoform X2 [Camelina sativa]